MSGAMQKSLVPCVVETGVGRGRSEPQALRGVSLAPAALVPLISTSFRGRREIGSQVSGFEYCLCPYLSPWTGYVFLLYLSGLICGEDMMTLFTLHDSM